MTARSEYWRTLILRSITIKMNRSADIRSHVWAAWRTEVQSPGPPLAYYYPSFRVNRFPREFHLTCFRTVRFLAYVCVCVHVRAMTLFFFLHLAYFRDKRGGGGDSHLIVVHALLDPPLQQWEFSRIKADNISRFLGTSEKEDPSVEITDCLQSTLLLKGML
jgi:hypothetical protein